MCARQHENMVKTPRKPPLRWISAADRCFHMRGLPWYEENDRRFDRLPARAEPLVSYNVRVLHHCPASANVAFGTDSTMLAVRVVNPDINPMHHMPATGQRSVSLYGGVPGCLRPWAVARPVMDAAESEFTFFTGQPRRAREFRIYLPLYKPLVKLEIGLDHRARVWKPSPLALTKPVVFYGTSITQGGCASTAGSDYVSTLGRRLNVETVNLGFSAAGIGEPIMAELMSEIDAAMYVLDYAANAGGPEKLKRTLPRFLRILRQTHPRTPILLLSHICCWQFDWDDARRHTHEGCRDVMMEHYVRARKQGDENIHFADGYSLIPFNTDGAYCDGVHPSDHGFQLMAERLAPVLERILFRHN